MLFIYLSLLAFLATSALVGTMNIYLIHLKQDKQVVNTDALIVKMFVAKQLKHHNSQIKILFKVGLLN